MEILQTFSWPSNLGVNALEPLNCLEFKLKLAALEQSVSIQTSDVDSVKMGCPAGRNCSFAEKLVIALWQLLLLLQPVNYSVLSKERGVVL